MIDHVNIVVSDIEKSVQFYTQVLGLHRGFEKLLEGPWIESLTGLLGTRARCVFLDFPHGGTRIELLQFLEPDALELTEHGAPHAIGARHIAFAVDDLSQVLGRLRDWGGEPLSEPVEVPFAVGNLGRKHLCYFRDPDGVLLEAACYEGSTSQAP